MKGKETGVDMIAKDYHDITWLGVLRSSVGHTPLSYPT
jgi:hypothetical protein